MRIAEAVATACLDDAVILDIVERRRNLDAAAEAHLADCGECRRVFAAVVRGTAVGRPEEQDTCDEPGFDELGQGVVIARRYELERFLGSGGMGVVWAARRMDRSNATDRVAIKIPRTADPALRGRFAREARVTASLDHPNVVRILDIIEATPLRGPCLVQELLIGESLDARQLREGALTLREAARIMVPVADAIAAAHARGILHRDLKPQNVFLAQGRIVVLDFGIAKLLPSWGAHSRLTSTGQQVVGTPRYMAPEQLFGESNPDERADVWALGALLYCMLAGRPPVEGRTMGEAIRAHCRGAPIEFGEVLQGLPYEVQALVRGALVVDRARRSAKVQTFVEVLRDRLE